MGSSLFWFVNWTRLGALYLNTPDDFYIDESVNNVTDVMHTGAWDADKLTNILPEEYAAHIIDNIKPPGEHQLLDIPYWCLETGGNFSVKSAWEYLRQRKDTGTTYIKMWVKGLPFKISFFMWKVWKAKLPLDDHMKKMGYAMPSRCWCCVQPGEETLQHLFFTSFAVKKVWSYFLMHAGIKIEGLSMHQAIVKCWTLRVISRLQTIFQALPAIIMWELWRRRNSYKHGEEVTIRRVIYHVSTTIQSLVRLRKPAVANIPQNWPDILQIMEQYTPKLKITKVL
ncbi:uncharacterized protein LOC142174878 [Nicotiana tabacum]|uniref:Uncharacterized protein LOC142174878 n=1 Tax=Nicotiana tabacum TaxID=4097 RepID=A0AC58TJG0_TOBAC